MNSQYPSNSSYNNKTDDFKSAVNVYIIRRGRQEVNKISKRPESALKSKNRKICKLTFNIQQFQFYVL